MEDISSVDYDADSRAPSGASLLCLFICEGLTPVCLSILATSIKTINWNNVGKDAIDRLLFSEAW